MRYLLIVAFLFFSFGYKLNAQKVSENVVSDSVQVRTERIHPVVSLDSIRALVFKKSNLQICISGKAAFQKNRISVNGGWYFYYFFFLMLFFALIKLAYPRYFNDLFRVFFRTSLKVNQIKEQLAASLWQSLLYNILFFLTAGFFLFFILKQFHYQRNIKDFYLLLVCTLVLLLTYLTKYLFLRFTGWLLKENQAADTYVFVVFLVNKMAGLMLLPVVAVMAFAPENVTVFVLWLSLFLMALFLAYRSLLGYQTAMSVSNLSNFHFLLYILAMEVAPLLILFRFLMEIF